MQLSLLNLLHLCQIMRDLHVPPFALQNGETFAGILYRQEHLTLLLVHLT